MDSSIPSKPHPADELNGVLGEVVEHIRATPAPSELTARAIERAAALSSDEPTVPRAQPSCAESAPTRSKWRRLSVFAPPLSAAAVLALVAFFSLRPHLSNEKPQTRGTDDEGETDVFVAADFLDRREAASKVGLPSIENEAAVLPGLDSETRPFRGDRIGIEAAPPVYRVTNISGVQPNSVATTIGGVTISGGTLNRTNTNTDSGTGAVSGTGALTLGGVGLSGRSGATKEKLLRQGGGNDPTEAATGRALSGSRAINAEAKDGGPAKNDPKTPQVWHRDQKRPTVARVYVGNQNSLELVSMHVSVTIEGPRARTVVDHIFRNPHDRQLEGTFEYPLPTGASPSYFAMFLGQTRDTVPPRFARKGDNPALPENALASLRPDELVTHVSTNDWGRLQEARVVSKAKALETYEDIVRGRIDPALLEYAGGNTFSGRVFPIPAKGFNRVIFAYEELLPCSQDQSTYRFALPDCKLTDLQLSLAADAGECKEPAFLPAGLGVGLGDSDSTTGAQLRYHRQWKEKGPGGEVIFRHRLANPRIQVISGRQGENGPIYLYARVRPDLAAQETDSFSENAVFMLDTSLSENPDRFAVSMKLLRQILAGDPGIKRFNVLAFYIASAWLEPSGWIDNTDAGREKALAKLDGIVLEGATDIGAALEKLVKPSFDVKPGTPVNVFLLSDGQITWGDSEPGPITARFESRCPYPTRFHCYRVGIGAENQELFAALTRKGGGVFNCFSEDDVASAAKAHRRQCMQIENIKFAGAATVSDVVTPGRKTAIYPDGELIVAARVNQPGKLQLILEGTFLGKKHVEELNIEVKSGAELAARGWAEIAVSELLALNDPGLDSLITAYCQQFGIGSRVASFLVLENENDYKRLNLEDERGKVLRDDMGDFLKLAWKQLGKATSAKDAFIRLLDRLSNRAPVMAGGNGNDAHKLLALLVDADFDIPLGERRDLQGSIVRRADLPQEYVQGLDQNPADVAVFVREARRRAEANDPDGATRALSGIVERYPTRADALRLVGYRLLDLRQPSQAVRLFEQVQGNRPFEPHSYRDLARSMEESGMFGPAALQYEIMLAGQWHNRFHESLKIVAREEYVRMIQEAVRRKDVRPEVKEFFGRRLATLGSHQSQSDLRVTISWNTDATDVDLWVIEPDGTKCFYQKRKTPLGGELSEDQTQGYGPERYQMIKAAPGNYTVMVHYFAQNPNLLGGETHVNVAITRYAGTPQETVERHNVILKKKDEQVEVARIKVP
jgi:von Willebrand factor type A domain/Vault protein inter-alpha-trypsin domain